MSNEEEESWETTSDTRDTDIDEFADDSSWVGTEDGFFEITTRRHHRAESAGNSSNTQSDSDNGYYGYDWDDEERDEKEDAVIPEPPHFDKLKSPHPKHEHQLQNLPDGFSSGSKDPLEVFQLFISDDTFGELAASTNAYATKREPENTDWSPTSAGEIKVFFGTILYMGICRSQDLEDYWCNKPGWPQYPIGKVISELRFRQLLEFFHIGPPDICDDEDLKGQLEPLGAKIREASMRYYLPGTEISFDRANDLNIFSLQHYSYTWNFLFHKDPPDGVETKDLEIQGMSFPVSTSAYQLASALPTGSHQFIIHANKHFTNVPLFSALRKIGIGAIGEATWRRQGFPESLQDLKGKYIPWNTVTGALAGPDNDVLAIVWRHFATCLMMTTIHEITPRNSDNYGKSEAYKNPAPPKDKPLIDAAFGNKKQAMIDQPRVALDHSDYSECKQNLFLKIPREKFSPRQLGKEPIVQARGWIMGLVWLLDVAVVNANVIARVCGRKATHDNFRMDVASGLMKLRRADSLDGGPSRKKARAS